jgi:hypothetical protein
MLVEEVSTCVELILVNRCYEFKVNFGSLTCCFALAVVGVLLRVDVVLR